MADVIKAMRCNLCLNKEVDVAFTVDAANGLSLEKTGNGYRIVFTSIEYHKLMARLKMPCLGGRGNPPESSSEL